MEQAEVFVLGGSTRASDSRIVLSFLFNAVLVGLCAYLTLDWENQTSRLQWLVPVFAFVASHNVLFAFGLQKPFKVRNEQLIQQHQYANIVFANFKQNEEKSDKQWKVSFVIKTLIEMICVALIIFLVQSMVAQDNLRKLDHIDFA